MGSSQFAGWKHKVRYSTSHPSARQAGSPRSWEVCTVFALLPTGTRVEAGAEAGCSSSSPFLAGAPWAATPETLCYRAKTQLASQAVVVTFQLEKAMAPTFLKDILFSVRNVKCLLISKTIKGDCRTVPFCLGNKGSNMLFSADLKHILN